MKPGCIILVRAADQQSAPPRITEALKDGLGEKRPDGLLAEIQKSAVEIYRMFYS